MISHPHVAGDGEAMSDSSATSSGISGLDLFRLDGRAAIVTGGGGALGLAMARGLVDAGASVLLVDRDLEKAQAGVAQIEADGGRAAALQGDVTDEATADDAVGA